MTFQFATMSDFFWMEGHGPYVWAAYGITFLGLCGLALKARLDRQNFYTTQASIAKRANTSHAAQ